MISTASNNAFAIFSASIAVTFVFAVKVCHAQYGTTAEVERPLASGNDVDPTASASVVDLEDRQSAGEAVQDVLPEVPGLQVSAFGGENSFVGVSLRGSELNHADVFIGDIPLGSIDGNAIDLSLLPLGAFGRIEVYRGGAPLRFGSSAIGGVVRFVPVDKEETEISLRTRAGSFETWELRGRAIASTPKMHLVLSAGVLGSKGNFTFDHDNFTAFIKDDDFVARRVNNDGRRGDGLAYLRVNTKRGEVSALFVGLGRARGEPGRAVDEASFSRLNQSVYLGAVSWKYDHALSNERSLLLNTTLSIVRERTRFDDPFREIGILVRESDDRRTQLQGRLVATVDVTRSLELTLFGRTVYDLFSPSDAVQEISDDNSHRSTLTLGLEARFHGSVGGWRWELRPSVQGHYSDARTENLRALQSGFVDKRGWFPSMRIGAGLGPTPWLSFVASGYRGLRLPSAAELFGNQGLIEPSPELDPEKAWGVDAGIVVKGLIDRHGRNVVRGLVDVRFFSQWYDDFIELKQASKNTFRADNVASPTSRGVESLGRATFFDHVDLLGSLTINKTSDSFGRWLQRRPRFLGRGRITLRSGKSNTLDELAVFFESTHVGKRFFDPANFTSVPSQTWLGAGVQVTAIQKSLILAVTLQDLLNRGGFTFLGYPLPGRRLSASIEYRKEL